MWDSGAGSLPDPNDDRYRDGPGTQLGELLKQIGVKEEPDCPCRSRMAEMDRRGCQWCRDNHDTIVGWLREEYDRRKKEYADGKRAELPAIMRLPFSEWAAKRLVLKAVRLAGKKSTPLVA